MILTAARLAAANLFAPETRAALWKVLGLTILLLIGVWFGLESLFTHIALPWLEGMMPDLPDWTGWFGIIAGILALAALALGLSLLIAPVSALIAGLFLDDVAEDIEKRHYPRDPVGTALPVLTALAYTLRFLGVVILGNILAFALLFVPGINIVAFFLVNGYLLGREFFEFAAMRYRSEDGARQMRQRHGTTIFLAGLVIAAFLAVPLLNLLTPLFAASLMVHLHKLLAARDARSAAPRPSGAYNHERP